MSRANIKQTFVGVIHSAKVVEASEPPLEQAPQPVPTPDTDIVSGVVAASVSFNALRPLQVLPAVWDVFSAPVALIDSNLSSFRLPDQTATINDYIAGNYGDDRDDSGVEYDATCLASSEGAKRQRIPGGDYNSYALEARAIMHYDTGADLRALFAGAAARSGVNLALFDWTGPFTGQESQVLSFSLEDHMVWHPPADSGGQGWEERLTHNDLHLKILPSDPAQMPSMQIDDDKVAIFDLIFTSTNGGTWQLYVLRAS